MARYKIEVKKTAVKELNNIPHNDLKKIIQKIQKLTDNPRPPGCKKLIGEEKYRILHMVEDDIY